VNFFDHQQRALRNTAWLLPLFALALAATVTLMAAVLGLAWGVLQWPGLDLHNQTPITHGIDTRAAPFGSIVRLLARTWQYLVPSGLVRGAAAGLAATMLAAAFWKLRAIAPGGAAVARMLDAREIIAARANALERRLRNIVEEMAIAAGLPVPRVFVLDRQMGINALTAGFSPRDAAIIVTRGALGALDRDELQGVVAHEFSHILHGDVRLNSWMIVLLAGLSFLSSLGARMFAVHPGAGILLGAPLAALGSIGLLFARLIQAGVSRQREYLADASAVRYTRNPDGLAGALARIERHRIGSVVAHRDAGALGHLFFAASVFIWFERVFATHPRLGERIARISPRFDAERYAALHPSLTEAQRLERAILELGVPASAHGTVALAGDADLFASVGNPTREHVAAATDAIGQLPATLRDALATADGARGVLLALALNRDVRARERQLAVIAAKDELLARIVRSLAASGGLPGPEGRLAVIELALPVLAVLGRVERAEFLGLLERVIAADGRVTLREFVLYTLLDEALGGRKPAARPVLYRALAHLAEEARVVLSLLAHAARV
jgi:Zn-dependent protease with chaperone function